MFSRVAGTAEEFQGHGMTTDNLPTRQLLKCWSNINQNLLNLGDELIIIIIHEYHRDASLKQNFRAAVCHVLH